MKTKKEVLEFLEKYPIRSYKCSLYIQKFIKDKFPDEKDYDDFPHKVRPDDPSAISFDTFEFWWKDGVVNKATFKNRMFIFLPDKERGQLAFRYALDLTDNKLIISDGNTNLCDGKNKVISISQADPLSYEKILERLKGVEVCAE